LDVLWKQKFNDDDLARLVAKGYDCHLASQMLEIANGDVEFALVMLRENKRGKTPKNEKKRFSFKTMKSQPTTECEKHFERPPLADEVDYALFFEPPKYGFEIKSGFNGRNAIVAQTLSAHAVDNLMPTSMICAVNKTCVIGKTLDEIRDEMASAMKKGSVVKIRFRAKRELLDKFWVHGRLVIMILGGQALRSAATHAAVRVNHAVLATKQNEHSSKNPVWNSTVAYDNLYPNRVSDGWLTVYRSTFTGPAEVGSAFFKLPKTTDVVEDQILELRDRHGYISGVVPIKLMLKSTGPY
jgi:hypothetical protein